MNRSITFAALTAVTLFASACTDDVDSALPQPATTTATAQIRVLHMSPDAPLVDVYANGADRVVADLAFSESTDFLEVPAGIYDFDVSPAGTSVGDSVLAINGLELEEGMRYTAVAFNNVAGIQALPLVDDFEDVADGQIRVRAIHAAPGVGEVDIWNVPAQGEPAPLYENVPFAGVGDYLDLPVGEYTIGIDVDDDAAPDLTFVIPEVPSGTIANIFATQDASGNVFLAAQLADGTVVRIDPTTN